ncbi:LOW QUALITY PROTEIN: heat shock 70 kDa protein 12B-like [Liolophura sinensis]|uniref:LOW QUALITY PROTEIN: heat shock 70 kDa protein 12B-like n=1 Tax=Liolophura sinensis TaxID=3198878 RepID=UPI003158AC18
MCVTSSVSTSCSFSQKSPCSTAIFSLPATNLSKPGKPWPSSKPLLVVAIDIGTTYSGYAFSFQHEFLADKLKITTNKVWLDGDNHLQTSYKTPTSVLFDPDGHFHSFGYEAETKYSQLAKNKEEKNWLLFRRFKMSLYKSEQQVVDSEIQYVLTVPAIWGEDAKQGSMRKAALQSGILGDQLAIALEPEAASIFCQSLADDISRNGSRYIVVDAGGGTVDTDCARVMLNGELKELHKASGGGWGGTQVDDQFTELLLKIFTKFTFRLPASLREVFSFHSKCSLEDQVAESGLSKDVRFTGDKMRISGKVMQSLMKPTIQKIITHVETLMADPKCRGISHILLVGGFFRIATSPRGVQEELRSVNVVTPLDAVLSVVKGAVIFGHRPDAIGIRLAAFTYGIRSLSTFVDGENDLDKLIMIEGERKCEDIFYRFVSVDEEVPHGMETREHIFSPAYSGQTALEFAVYKSTVTEPKYTTDPSCLKLGSFTVDMPDLTGDKKRKVGVKFIVGGTELKVKAHEKTTGKIFDAIFNFVTKRQDENQWQSDAWVDETIYPSIILLVGGFSKSPLLQEEFRENFRSVTVITPPDDVLSVVKACVSAVPFVMHTSSPVGSPVPTSPNHLVLQVI